jgi:hypothetical protein
MESKNVKFTEAESKVFSRGGEQKKTWRCFREKVQTINFKINE